MQYVAEKTHHLAENLHNDDFLIVFRGVNDVVPVRTYRKIISDAVNKTLPIASRTNIINNTIPTPPSTLLQKHLMDDAIV